MTDDGTPKAAKQLAKSHTFAAITVDNDAPVSPETSHPSATGVPGRHAISAQHLRSASRSIPVDPECDLQDSIMNNSQFGSRYAYGAAESAAFTATEPWKMPLAVGRDVGQFVLGRMGWRPATAEPEEDETQLRHETCVIMKARLREQAEARAAEERARREKEQAADPAARSEEGLPDDQERGASSKSEDEDDDWQGDDMKPPEGVKADAEMDDHEDLTRVSTSSTAASGDITITGSGHYEPHNDALLRLETMTAAEVRFLNFALWAWLTMALGFLIYEFVQKLVNERATVRSYNTVIINTVMGGICFAFISASMCCHFHRLYQTRKFKKVWKPRRFKFAVFTAIELVTQWINLLFFLLPNVISYGPKCFRIKDSRNVAWFALVRWTCWNTLFLVSIIHANNANQVSEERALTSSAGQRSSLQRRKGLQKSENVRPDVAVLDLPFLQAHWWKLIIWAAMECSVVASHVYYAETVGTSEADASVPADLTECWEANPDCAVSSTALGLVSIMVFFCLGYFFLYCYFIHKALKQLQTKSSVEFKIANVVVRLQMRLRLPAFGFFILSLLLLWYVKPFSCNSLIDTWFGMLPGQLAATAAVLLISFVGTPKSCGGHMPILQVWLQEFAWTEEEKARKVARRNASLPPSQVEEIQKEPMFCVETMMTCLYWSLLIYDYLEVEDSKLNLPEACGLFDPPLDQFELFWEKSLDTKMILAWSRERMVLAFRGTASLSNVVADLQAWRVDHQPKRGSAWNRPKVHSGFHKAWRNNSLNTRVIMRIKELIKAGEVDPVKLRFIVTGHSLGGALATLAAYDVRAVGKKYGKDCKVSCYTFGAPRTGNHAFATDFQQMVPDCWHVINDQDVVARGAKFWVLYKRGGHRVLINSLGDLIVRPTAMETSLRLVPCSGSVQQHLLTSYLNSMLAVLLSQFSRKRIKGGMTGVVELAKNNTAIKRLLMEQAGLTFKELLYMSRWGAYAPRVAEIAELPITGRRKSVAAQLKDRKLDGDAPPSTRGGFLFGCCASTRLKVNEARGDEGAADTAADANVVDGGDVDTADGSAQKQ